MPQAPPPPASTSVLSSVYWLCAVPSLTYPTMTVISLVGPLVPSERGNSWLFAYIILLGGWRNTATASASIIYGRAVMCARSREHGCVGFFVIKHPPAPAPALSLQQCHKELGVIEHAPSEAACIFHIKIRCKTGSLGYVIYLFHP